MAGVKQITVLGATGSIGQSSLALVKYFVCVPNYGHIHTADIHCIANLLYGAGDHNEVDWPYAKKFKSRPKQLSRDFCI